MPKKSIKPDTSRTASPNSLVVLLWLAIIGLTLALIALIWAIGYQGTEAQLQRSHGRVATACQTLIETQSRILNARDTLPIEEQATMNAAVDLALRDQPGIEGGIWKPQEGIVAYAFPTYDGSRVKSDVPAAERERIEALAANAFAVHSPLSETRPGSRETVLLQACPIARHGLVGWTMMRVPTLAAESLDQLTVALGLLLAFVLVSGSWLLWTITRWSHGLTQLIEALRRAGPNSEYVIVAEPLGMDELNQIADALNAYARRLQRAKFEAKRLATELTQSQRMALLGRMAVGLAHEIRNPLGAMRLRAENALAAPDNIRDVRQRDALNSMNKQIQRLETLVASLLALTQPFHIERHPVDIDGWLQHVHKHHQDKATRQGIGIQTTIIPECTARLQHLALFDPAQMERALDNLILNALDHLPPGGSVHIDANCCTEGFVILVNDDGPGIPEALLDQLFNPFVKGRAGGVGLGLALVWEVVQAHGGHIQHRRNTPNGACFEIKLPWPES